MLKHESLLWKAALHHEQLMATISLEPNDNLDWKDCNNKSIVNISFSL